MRLRHTLQKWIPAAALGLLLAASPSVLRAASDIPIVLDSGLSAWLCGWSGTPAPTLSYDSANSALEVQATWTSSGGGEDCYIDGTATDCNGWLTCGSTFDGTAYASLDFDIMFSSSSTLSFVQTFQMGFDHGYSFTSLSNIIPVLDGTWHHYSLPIKGTETGVTGIYAAGFYCWQQAGNTGTLNWEVKNVVFKAKVVPIPPPTLANPEPIKATGLWLGTYAGGGGARNSIYTPITTGNGVSWVGVATPSTPVTYTMTIAQYPNSALYPGIQSHIFLSSDAANGEGAPEWNSTNSIFFRIMNNADGSAYAVFMIKTNSPGANGGNGWGGQIYGTGQLALINSTTVTGKWSLTFSNDTNVTITTPDNTSTNFSLDPSYPPYFQYVFASFGIQQNTDTYGGQYAILSHAGISAPYSIDDYFTSGIPDSSFSLAGPEYGAQTVAPGSGWYAKWYLPASGFSLIVSPDLSQWADDPSTNTWTFDVYGWAPVPQSALGANSGYFQMVKRTATQLQVLLPGETNAPGTLTGKTGTPDPQTVGNPFNLTINACDTGWHIATSCNDTVALTSTDASAWLGSGNATLVRGTVTIVGNTYFGSSGTWTITATDTNSVSPGVSTPITIP